MVSIQSPLVQALVPLIFEGDVLRVLDQRLLPDEVHYEALHRAHDVARAIECMMLRGAPLIGVAAAYGLALEACALAVNEKTFYAELNQALVRLAATRPTAINLNRALTEGSRRIHAGGRPDQVARALLEEAHRLARFEIDASTRMGQEGAAHLGSGSRLLTHCNTGCLATVGEGTALAVVRHAFRTGRALSVTCTETRPWLQGARLSAFELAREGWPTELVTESVAGDKLLNRAFDWFLVGADRIGPDGRVANKMGTHMLSQLARLGGARVMVVAPTTTIDWSWDDDHPVPIEHRDGAEVWRATGSAHIPPGVRIDNPVFDVTSAELVDWIVTECGAIEPTRGESFDPLRFGGIPKAVI
ncbi:MAG: S-methyl-5-thioribose-1-phosphate isomerase [Gammaproteobacteria bacterium]